MTHLTETQILDFLNGRLSPEQALEIGRHARECPACSALLDEQIEIERMLLESTVDKRAPILSDNEWDSIIQNSVKKQKSSVILQGWFTRHALALAAGLALLAGGYFMFKPSLLSEPAVPVVQTPLRAKPAQPLNVADKAVIVPSVSARVRVTRDSARVVVASLDTGSAVFSVTPGASDTFRVETPDAIVTVTGTLFDVLVSGNHTRVSVIRGSVSVLYKNLQRAVDLLPGKTASLSDTSAVVRDMLPLERSSIAPFLPPETSTSLPKAVIPAAVVQAAPVPVAPSAPEPDRYHILLNSGLKALDGRNYAAALASFEEVAAGNGTGSDMQTALFESGRIKIRHLNRAGDGIRDLDTYVSRFGAQGLYAEEALSELITAHRKSNNTDGLLNAEERYIKLFSDRTNAREHHYEAATLLREAKKDYGRAAEYYTIFTDRYPRDYRVEDALYWGARCLLEAGQEGKARELFRNYLNQYPQGRWASDIQKLTDR